MASTMDGFAPMYPAFGTDIYASDVVQQALSCITDEIAKLRPAHIRMKDNDPVPITNSSIYRVLNNPNPLMTTAEFLSKTTWLLLLNYNAFIIPVYKTWVGADGEERREYEALYPINPAQVDFIEDVANRLYVKIWFRNGTNTTIPYDDVIHLRKNFSVSDYMGGDYMGQPDNKALLKTLQLNHELLEGVAKAMNASYTINGVVTYKSLMSKEETDAAAKELTERLKRNEAGFASLGMDATFQPFQKQIALVDATTLKFIDEKILRNFGVPLPILSGDFSKEQYQAFYQKTLEKIIIAFSQAFTKKLFTDRERSFGNKVEFYPEDLIFMTVAQRLEMINILSPTGAIFENEKRAALGLRPLPELEGERYMSLNWINANNAAQYQVGEKVNVDVVDENKEVTDV